MQLEKVTAGSGEAGLAGWISSNDVTLFTVVLVVVIAIFLQTSLVRGSKENVQLEAVNVSLSDRNEAARQEIERVTGRLEETESSLQAVRSQLAAATSDLRDTRQELDTAVQQLAMTRDELEQTSRRRDELERIRGQLDQRLAERQADVDRLKQSLAALEIERGELLESRQDLTTTTQQLSEQRNQLDESLAELGEQLKQKLQQLDDLRRERDLLDEQSRALSQRVARLEQQLGTSREELAEIRQSGDVEMGKLQQLLAEALERNQQSEKTAREEIATALTRARQSEAATEQARATADDYLQRLQRAAAVFKETDENKRLLQLQVEALKTQLANALDDLKAAEQQVVLQQQREKSVHRELLGLRGELRRVAVVVDASGSMNEGGRWQQVQQTVATWLDHLDVEECVLIVFSSDVTAYPADGTLFSLKGPDGEANRARMLQYLRSLQPKGWTNTLAAMQRAYAHTGIDTIILFSDGAPTLANSNQFHHQAAQQIYTLARQYAHIPVNAVGVGNYFDPELATFLQSVANLTGGTFIGR